MFKPGDIISYMEMCMFEGFTVQQGMNFHVGKGGVSVLLMSTANNSPYDDESRNEGRTIIYEGHDIRRDLVKGPVKNYDQPLKLPSGGPTANGKFFKAAKQKIKEKLRLYEKIKTGIWVYNGEFILEDSYIEESNKRKTIKFVLNICDQQKKLSLSEDHNTDTIEHTRFIPSWVKFEVYKRDGGKCTICHANDNLHYDHILPFSKGGSSLLPKNIQLLCARHNLQKSDKIE